MEQYKNGNTTGIIIAYCGVEGSFASLAAARILPGSRRIGYPTFEDAYLAVKKSECDAVLLPLENSSAGEIGTVLDLIFYGNLFIDGVFESEIRQCLLGIPGSNRYSIKKVLSHPQAIQQCSRYLHSRNIDAIPYSNTAMAAQNVASHNLIEYGAIASEETANLYGLEVLEANINDNVVNITKFALMTKKTSNYSQILSKTNNNSTLIYMIMFTVDNTPGSLASILSIIGNYGFNMRVIRSRPYKSINEIWKYYFFVEIEGDIFSSKGMIMNKCLEKICSIYKIVGRY